MLHKLLLCLFLFSIVTVKPMDKISKEIITYNVGPNLNRSEKNSFRTTNKKHAQAILPQHILNEYYERTCKTANTDAMLEWRRKGALHLHEEIYNAFINEENDLTQQLLQYYANKQEKFSIKSAFFHGIHHNKQTFIVFLLQQTKTTYPNNFIHELISYALTLNNSTISKTLTWYREKNTTPTDTRYGRGGGVPPLPEDCRWPSQ